jgi:hypothetical protein
MIVLNIDKNRINGMRLTVLFTAIITLSIFLHGSGCTRIESPVRYTEDDPDNPEGASPEELSIIPDKSEILDTEPLRIQARGGNGEITWSTQPQFEDSFLPATGDVVLFSPPDISSDAYLTIIAKDQKNKTARAEILVIDEGFPPETGDILINEIAWAGTLKNWRDEYIELINKTDRTFYLDFWSIENMAGSGISFYFSGKISPGGLFLITNYAEESEGTAISAPVDCADSGLSIPNSVFGPFILKNYNGKIYDTVGDGGTYQFGANSTEVKASMSRYTSSASTVWEPGSWYTETLSINLLDETMGTPGARNSDETDIAGTSGDSAGALITEYSIDAGDEIGEDWVELFIKKSGSIRDFILTDLDGTDLSITGGKEIEVEEDQYILVVWGSSDEEPYRNEGNRFYIPDTNPTGTKDELVILCNGNYLDGLCYHSTGDVQFDDMETILGIGWTGDPVFGKYAARKKDDNGLYMDALDAFAWDTAADPTPGAAN